MTESERQSWEQERAQGRDRFILRGMWRRGIRYAIIFSVIFCVLQFSTGYMASLRLAVWNCLVMIAALTVGGGWCEGASVWYKREREYSESKKT